MKDRAQERLTELSSSFKEAALNADVETMESIYNSCSSRDKGTLLTDIDTFANIAMDETGNTLNWLLNHEKEAKQLDNKGSWDTNREIAVIMLIKEGELEAAERIIASIPAKERLAIISGAARYERAQNEKSKRVLEYTMTHAYLDETGRITIHTYNKNSKTYITFKVQDDKLITTSAIIADKQGVSELDISKLSPMPFSELDKFDRYVVRIGVAATELQKEDLMELLVSIQEICQAVRDGEPSIAKVMKTREQTRAAMYQHEQITEETISETSELTSNDLITNAAIPSDESNYTSENSQA